VETARSHWNKVYSNCDVSNLGWFEADPEPSVSLIEELALPRGATVLDVGSGCSTLIPTLLDRGHTQLVAVDVSDAALELARSMLSVDKRAHVQWIRADISAPGPPGLPTCVELWHDRALFHFLLSQPERRTYIKTLRHTVCPGGSVIIATFSLDGVNRCSGLDVRRYDADMLSREIGDGFVLVKQVDYLYVTPSGEERPYVYCVFRREVG
jgi:cyclopropane fatty-acyl-phospholipid synthase-like methyltransferase